MQPSALIFDHDGTLVDSERLHFQSWHTVMADFGIKVTEQEYIEHHNGIPTLQNAQVFIDTYGIESTPESLRDRKQAHFAMLSENTPSPLMPTVIATLERAMNAGHQLAIATGADSSDLQRSLAAHRLNDFFSAIATRDDVVNGKPAPDVYLLACEKLGAEPGRAIAFEDTQAGVRAAKAAGLTCIAIPNDYSLGQDLSEADAKCASLLEAYLWAIQQ